METFLQYTWTKSLWKKKPKTKAEQSCPRTKTKPDIHGPYRWTELHFFFYKKSKAYNYNSSIEWFLICTNLHPLHERMHCINFGYDFPSCPRVDTFKKLSKYFHYVAFKEIAKMACLFITKKSKHPRKFGTEFPWPKDEFFQVWIKLSPWF